MQNVTITPIPLLQDNYAWLIEDHEAKVTAVVDPSEAAPVVALIKARGGKLDLVLNTHHHGDHTGGNVGLKAAFGCEVVGPGYDQGRIAGMDRGVKDGDTVAIGRVQAQVLFIPGHTSGHVAFYAPELPAVFCGDTLFSLGCGRLFEGSPEQMHRSLTRLAALPPETRVYCGHEYTAANATFALSLEPKLPALRERAAEVAKRRAEGQPTVPSSLAEERAANPFLRVKEEGLRRALGMATASDLEVFTEVRQRKDHFKSP